MDVDAKEFVSVATEKMSNLCNADLAFYEQTGNTPLNKPISKNVELVKSLSHSALREQYKQIKQNLASDDQQRTSSSPRKRKTSDDNESSSRSSIESIPVPVLPAKKAKETVVAGEPLKNSNTIGSKKPLNIDKPKPVKVSAKENKTDLPLSK